MAKKSVERHEQRQTKLQYEVTKLVGRHWFTSGRFDTLEEAEQHKSSLPAHLKPKMYPVKVTPLENGNTWVSIPPEIAGKNPDDFWKLVARIFAEHEAKKN